MDILNNCNKIICSNLSEKNNCYICLNDIDYYYCFDCNCHNFVHESCIKDVGLTYCVFCKKIFTHKINDYIYPQTHNDNYGNDNLDNMNKEFYKMVLLDFALTDSIINFMRIEIFYNKLLLYIQIKPNIFLLFLWIIFTIFYSYFILLPLLTINIMFNYIKNFKVIHFNWIYKFYGIKNGIFLICIGCFIFFSSFVKFMMIFNERINNFI